ncbi:hypothetical protein MKX08_000141 [Trichoderma sp. CBMAI-0020]|nr:hypothetical protein MKX08_000141 [Trichoderma sp. CBMAI-0020]
MAADISINAIKTPILMQLQSSKYTGILGPSVVEVYQRSGLLNITLLARAKNIDAVKAQFPDIKVTQIAKALN